MKYVPREFSQNVSKKVKKYADQALGVRCQGQAQAEAPQVEEEKEIL